MSIVLTIENARGRRELSRDDISALASQDVAARAGRFGEGMDAVTFAGLTGSLPDDPAATHATFHAADGYAASIPIGDALERGVVVLPDAGRVGVRLVVEGGGTACLNVKAVTRIELTVGPGKHTVNPNPHDAARVPGWDVRS